MMTYIGENVEGRDPTLYEMVLKMSAVQRRLIKKTEEVIVKEVELRDLERVNGELKKQLQRRPGPDIGEELSKCRGTIKARNKQIKASLVDHRCLSHPEDSFTPDALRCGAVRCRASACCLIASCERVLSSVHMNGTELNGTWSGKNRAQSWKKYTLLMLTYNGQISPRKAITDVTAPNRYVSTDHKPGTGRLSITEKSVKTVKLGK